MISYFKLHNIESFKIKSLKMVMNAKKDFIKKYSKENYLKLIKIYNEAIQKKKKKKK